MIYDFQINLDIPSLLNKRADFRQDREKSAILPEQMTKHNETGLFKAPRIDTFYVNNGSYDNVYCERCRSYWQTRTGKDLSPDSVVPLSSTEFLGLL